MIIVETIAIIVLASFFGWYNFRVQNNIQYTGDPLQDPNGYQTQWVVATATSYATLTVRHSDNQYPTSNLTYPFSVEAKEMNSYLVISYAACAQWQFQNSTSQTFPPPCVAPASMSMYIINSMVCLGPGTPVVREPYTVQSHMQSNVVYESGNVSTSAITTARFPVPAGNYCIVIADAGLTDLTVFMYGKVEFTTV